MTIEVRPLTAGRWEDLLTLFGPNGATSGCWCMWWRLKASEFDGSSNEEKRGLFEGLVGANRVPGLLAYRDGVPVGWVSVAPRQEFGRLERSPVLGPVDEEPVWSVVCFYIHRRHRRSGVGETLLRAAVDRAIAQGARIVEGYPVDTLDGKVPGASIYTGIVSMFQRAGFREVERRRPRRPIMRWHAPA